MRNNKNWSCVGYSKYADKMCTWDNGSHWKWSEIVKLWSITCLLPMDVGKKYSLCHTASVIGIIITIKLCPPIPMHMIHPSAFHSIFYYVYYIIQSNGTIISRGFRYRRVPSFLSCFFLFERSCFFWFCLNSVWLCVIHKFVISCLYSRRYNWFRWLNCFMNWKANKPFAQCMNSNMRLYCAGKRIQNKTIRRRKKGSRSTPVSLMQISRTHDNLKYKC